MRLSLRLIHRLPPVPARDLLASLVLHGIAAGLALAVASWRPPAPPPVPVYTVALVVDPTAGPPAGPPVAAPATASVNTEPEPAVPVPAKPSRPSPKPAPRRERTKPAPRETPAARAAAVEPSTDPPATTASPAVPPASAGTVGGAGLAAGGGGGAAGIPAIDSEQFPFLYYRDLLTTRLRYTWGRPLIPGGLREPIRAVVHFEVLRGGGIQAVDLARPSGYAPLDRSALRAVYDASPLPPLPEEFEGDRLAVNFFFELTPE